MCAVAFDVKRRVCCGTARQINFSIGLVVACGHQYANTIL